MTNGQVVLTSDKRYKRNISKLNSGLNNLLKLDAVSYNNSGDGYRELVAD
jgi:hypothetical protein